MRRTHAPMVVAGLALLLGCAAEAPQRKARPDEAAFAGYDTSYRPGSTRIGGGEEEPDDGLVVEHEKGALDGRDVDRVLDRHARALVACYDRAGAAQRYASGDVLLRFFVASSGEVSNVLVVDSTLGNYEVERCLVAEGRKISFPAPGGRKATDFEYSLRFRSSGEIPVVDWAADAVARDVAQLAPQLASCGSLGPGSVRAVVYIEPGGSVDSVGLSSESPVDAAAAQCVVDRIRTWRLPDGRGHMIRTSFAVSPLPAAPPPAKPARLVRRVSR